MCRIVLSACRAVGEMQKHECKIRQFVIFPVRFPERRERAADLCKLSIVQRRFSSDQVGKFDDLQLQIFLPEGRQRVLPGGRRS